MPNLVLAAVIGPVLFIGFDFISESPGSPFSILASPRPALCFAGLFL